MRVNTQMLKSLNKYFFFFFANVAVFCACNKTDFVTLSEDQTEQYIIRQLEDTLVYEVNKASKGTSSETDTTYDLQEIVNQQVVSTDKIVNTLYRFSKATAAITYPVLPQAVWKSELSPFRYVKVEDNVRYVRLEFPLSQSKNWDGNDENIENQEQYEVKWVGQPYALNDSVTFNETVYISQKKIETISDTINFYEVYAKNVGLIEKFKDERKYEIIETLIDTVDFTITYITELESSSFFHQKLKTNATN
ncbi:MAG: hypothetical protein AB8B61_05095 [Cyclobacteriaceae bacterium]